MLKQNKRGFIGVMLTMAVGIALGAAALVVSTEIAKDKKQDAASSSVSSSDGSAKNVEKAFDQYQKAYREYQQAAGLGRDDVKKYADAFKSAKRELELAILKNTPGVSEMDLTGIDDTSVSSASSASKAAETQPVSRSSNPFGVDTVVINSPSGDTSYTPSSAVVSSSAAAPSSGASGASSASGGGSSASAGVKDDQITGMDYYKVKSGDSLSKICEKYYGDSGMWQHIVKYQMSSIAASPNMIFAGQLIALPRGIAKKTSSQTVKKDSSTTTGSASGKFDIAPVTDESWQNKFQKDYLISDNALTDTSTMTVSQIQKFLESKNSVLAKPYNGSTPAQMIYNAAKKYGINPQVLLTRLQCEQGLISATSATKKRLDWALGVGCYDSGNWNQKFKGLDKQIEFAAHTYRRHYDDAKARLKKGEKITMSIDGQQITVKNAASYSFYKYCPHVQGCKLFYDVWRGYRSKF
ncbi:MAG: LysM peptidoglycan-binding domain-containing protein [Erysipelotrichia bacterium]|nr:LysM peptidoglycan-binding domain-containing protein [Erysipelotrichia bacterium]